MGKSSKKDGQNKKGNKGKNSSNRENSKKDGKNKKGNKRKNSGNRENSKKDGENKKGNKGKNSNSDRKYVKKPSKVPSAENAEKQNKRLNKLGFTKLPTKSTLDGLDCMWNKLEDLLVKCGEKILSKTP